MLSAQNLEVCKSGLGTRHIVGVCVPWRVRKVFEGFTHSLISGDGPFPGVIDLFGTAGGLLEYRSAQLASRGIASFALAFFAYDDLPKALEEFNISYFEEAVQFLLNQEKVTIKCIRTYLREAVPNLNFAEVKVTLVPHYFSTTGHRPLPSISISSCSVPQV